MMADGERGEAHTSCEMVSAFVVWKSREMVVSGQRGSPGKCHNSRPMVASAPDLRRLHLGASFLHSHAVICGKSHLGRTLEQATLNYHHLSFIQTP